MSYLTVIIFIVGDLISKMIIVVGIGICGFLVVITLLYENNGSCINEKDGE